MLKVTVIVIHRLGSNSHCFSYDIHSHDLQSYLPSERPSSGCHPYQRNLIRDWASLFSARIVAG